MATKKASKKKGTRAFGSKSAGAKATKKPTAAKSASKASAAKSATKASAAGTASKVSQGSCRNWKAWHDREPGGPPTLHVTGSCRFPTHGFKVIIRKAAPQGINPAIRLLRKVVTPPSGPVILVPQTIQVHYREKTNAKLTHVTILPEVVTIKVQQVS